MHRVRSAVLCAAAFSTVAVFGLAGCADDTTATAPPVDPPSLNVSRTTTTLAAAPLPAPDELTGVLYRLADTSIPAPQKVPLVQYATADDEPALQNFGEALSASGFDPLDVAATDLAWAGDPGHVLANVTISSTKTGVTPFAFPMEFSPVRDTWQLSRGTADQLLSLVASARPPG